MKKILSKKSLALILFLFLLPIAYCLFTTPTHAQEIQLLPSPSPNDVKIETAPYTDQDYQIQTASPDPITDWLLENTLGKLVNAIFGKTKENMMKWLGDVINFGIINLHTLLVGQAGTERLLGSGICVDENGQIIEQCNICIAKDGLVTNNQCNDGYVPEAVGDYCQCVRQVTAAPRNPSDYGMVGVMGAMTMGTLQQGPPDMHLAYFVKNELADNIVATPAYAKTGSAYFDPVIRFWSLTRNISYILMVIILVAMGFMVMMRKQVDPRTVMTVTAALPRIAVSLVLIAFSYPIAGIIVDLGRLGKGLIDATFGSLMTLHSIEPFQMIVDTFGNFVAVTIFNPLTWGGWGNISLGGTGVFAFAIQCGISIIALVVAFMLFFTLVFRFAGLFMQVVFAPLAFAWGALPGQGDTISRWFKSFAVNVLCFPAIYFVVNLANYIAVISLSKPMSLPGDLGWGSIDPNVQTNVGGLVAFGLLMAATRVPAMLEDAFAVTAPAAVSKAGIEPGKILGRLPFVGKMLK